MASPPPPNPKPMKRLGYGSSGTPCDLYCNYFPVSLTQSIDVGQYDVTISYSDEPGKPISRKAINRKVLGKLAAQQKFSSVVFDGERNLYSLTQLPFNTEEFTVTLDRAQRQKAAGQDDTGKKRRTETSSFKVRISLATKVDMKCLLGKENLPKVQDALRVLDVLLREQAARMDYIQLRESYFHESLGPVGNLGEGVDSWRGYHASFRRGGEGRLVLNLDPSTTVVLQPMPVHLFISEFMKKKPEALRPEDFTRAKRLLKGIEVQVYAGTKHKIFNFSDQPASRLSFERKEKVGDGTFTTVTNTVEEYYKQRYGQNLSLPYLPCVDVGKSSRPVYIPMEFCRIVPGQRYKRKLNGGQTRKHMDEARQKPDQRMAVINKGMSELLKNAEVDLRAFNIKVDTRMLEVKGRILPAPSLKFGRGDEVPGMGTWNFNRKTVAKAAPIPDWSVISFSRGGEQEARRVASELKNCCNNKGMNMNEATHFIVEQPRNSGKSPYQRVELVKDELKSKLQRPPSFVLCILPQKECDLYAPFKRLFLTQLGVVNQCIVPPRQLKDQYLTNVALKINAKCGGYNSVLTKEFAKQLPKLSEAPTLILGMDVSHGQTATRSPSLAAIVGSKDWPRITQYAARVKTQSPRQEDIANISEMLTDLIKEFHASSKQKPYQILIFRDGVSESQFESVLSLELGQVIQTCQKLGLDNPRPKITLVVAQKRHHTRFFPRQGSDNIRPGTVVDRVVTHPTNYDFFLSSHKGLIGTTRPTHYVVLYDEIGFTPDEMQNTVNQLCYTYVKSTTAVSVVAPVYYAHLAAQKARNFMSFDASESGSSHRGGSGAEGSSQLGGDGSRKGDAPVPEMPKLHDRVANTMFFV